MTPTRALKTRRNSPLDLVVLLALAATTTQATSHNPFIKQQFLVGNQTPTLEPYNLPPEETAQIFTKTPSSEATWPIQGYNIFSQGGQQDFSSLAVSGWRIQIKIASDISLQNANIPDPDAMELDDEDFCTDTEDTELEMLPEDLTDQVFDTALISLLPPDNLSSGSSGGSTDAPFANSTGITNGTVGGGISGGGRVGGGWTLCAAVWITGLFLDEINSTNTVSPLDDSTSNSNSDNADSSCTGVVSAQCIADMADGFNAAAQAGQNCQNQTLPDSCASAFKGLEGLPAFNLPMTLTGSGALDFTKPIFAASTYPFDVSDENSTAVAEVNNWVFPIVMSWSRGQGSDTQAQSHLSCIRVNRELATSPSGGDGAGGDSGSGSGSAGPDGPVIAGAPSAARGKGGIWAGLVVGLGLLVLL